MALRATLSKVTPDEARIEAELLVAHTLEISRAAILAHPEIELSEDQSVRLAGIEARRIGGEPLAYILGNRQFFGLEFEVGPDVLIPRPETELLVSRTIEIAADKPFGASPLLIADLGTGSGCIAIALATRLRRGNFLAVDIHPGALAVATRNARRHRVLPRIAMVEADLADPLGPVHILVCNPPYVPTAEVDQMLSEPVHEPRAALDGGGDGLDCYRRLLPLLPHRLRRPGVALLELGYNQFSAVRGLAEPLGAGIRAHQDLLGYDRVIELRFNE